MNTIKGEKRYMRYPEFLKENGIIGFVAPSFGCSIEPYKTAFQNALRRWEEMGYKTHLGPNCYASSGIGISNNPKLCGEELNEWYCSDENDIIISCAASQFGDYFSGCSSSKLWLDNFELVY